MRTVQDICSLDYLIGTLSTAYKGIITSLAARDFCMSEEGESVALRGAVLSLPAGNYEASLIEKGIELARTVLDEGRFELKVPAVRVRQAKDLQIDVIQAGRHIGTFLLKKQDMAGFYLPAVELSEEVKGIDFKLLTLPLRQKVGLLQKAEAVITEILSPKKDWPAFSEKLSGLAEDVFWSTRPAFYGAFTIFARFLARSAERADALITPKPVGDFLGLIELPLEHDTEDRTVRTAVDAWLTEIASSRIDFTPQLARTARTLGGIHARFPDAAVGLALQPLLDALQDRLSAAPILSDQVLRGLEAHLPPELFTALVRHSAANRKKLLAELDRAIKDMDQGSVGRVFGFLNSIDPAVLGDAAMTAVFLEIVSRASADSADAITAVLHELFTLLPKMSRRSLENIRAGVPVLMEKLVSLRRIDLCRQIFDSVAAAGSPLREDIAMNGMTARAVLKSANENLAGRYRDILTMVLIPAPGVRSLSPETWAEEINSLHLELLARFLEILEAGGNAYRDVLAYVIANTAVSGLFIPDDRLFQRRISAYLNSAAMQAPFLLNYLLLAPLPVYFNQVGAVDAIRDYSTEIDAWGNDPVLYFLRKQVHVNASNYNIRLIEQIISSWTSGDPALLAGVIPPDVRSSLKPEIFSRYAAVIRPLLESVGALDDSGVHVERLLVVPEQKFKVKVKDGQLDEIPSKIMLLFRLYRAIVNKYSSGPSGDTREDPAASLAKYVQTMRSLREIILRPEKTEATESLYFKRHIAFGIPSVLGTYHEPKFDALGEFLRQGRRARVMLERSAAGTERNGRIEAREVEAWIAVLCSSNEILKLHGLSNMRIDEVCETLHHAPLRLSQVADLLRVWQRELAWSVRFFSSTFSGPLTGILNRFPPDDLPAHLRSLGPSKPYFVNRASDAVIRDLIARVPGLMESDRLIERLLARFDSETASGTDPVVREETGQRPGFFNIDELTDQDAARLAPLLGSKAKNLVYLHDRGFRTPAGVVIPARDGEGPLSRDVLRHAVRTLEEKTGKKFGGSDNPLFLAVRSGSYVSMPGILSTILYCGMNRESIEGFVRQTGDPRLACDSQRRFIEQYGATVSGIDPAVFENTRQRTAAEFGLPGTDQFDAKQLEALVGSYWRELAVRGLEIPQDVEEQLARSVQAIFASWQGPRAVQFRRATKTSVHWGTAVLLMEMLPANRAGAGASVFFTRNPHTLDPEVYGETREASTGDDLVYGRRLNRPLLRKQADESGVSARSLEEIDPELFGMHQDTARQIEERFGGLPQEVEAAYLRGPEGRSLFVLQARRMEYSAGQAETFDEICRMESRIIGRGIGAHGGALSGVASFAEDPDEAARLARESGMPVILFRTTANTEDVSLMPVIRGIVTASGGVTSHAAVLAQKFGLAAVIGCSGMEIRANEQGARFARIGQFMIKEGTPVSIEGASGLVFAGTCLNVSPATR